MRGKGKGKNRKTGEGKKKGERIDSFFCPGPTKSTTIG